MNFNALYNRIILRLTDGTKIIHRNSKILKIASKGILEKYVIYGEEIYYLLSFPDNKRNYGILTADHKGLEESEDEKGKYTILKFTWGSLLWFKDNKEDVEEFFYDFAIGAYNILKNTSGNDNKTTKGDRCK